MTFTEPFIPKQLLIHSSLVYLEYSQESTTYGDRDSLNKYKRFEIIPTIFSDLDVFKVETNYKKKADRTTNTCRLNNMLLKNNWVREEIKREIKRHIETNDNDSTTYQNFLETA